MFPHWTERLASLHRSLVRGRRRQGPPRETVPEWSNQKASYGRRKRARPQAGPAGILDRCGNMGWFNARQILESACRDQGEIWRTLLLIAHRS
jgi:hypothetical protein